jgi:hypothetical protein
MALQFADTICGPVGFTGNIERLQSKKRTVERGTVGKNLIRRKRGFIVFLTIRG